MYGFVIIMARTSISVCHGTMYSNGTADHRIGKFKFIFPSEYGSVPIENIVHTKFELQISKSCGAENQKNQT